MIKDLREMYKTLGGFYATVSIISVVVAFVTTTAWAVDVIIRALD